MIAWYWLIVVFLFGFTGGMFLTALMKANDPYHGDEVEINPPWLERPDDGQIIIRDEHGNMLKYDIYGISIYDPEEGAWKSLN